MESSQSDSPGVRLFPPLHFLAGFALAWVIHLLLPIPVLPARSAGIALVVTALVLVAWVFSFFLRARTNPRPDRAAAFLLTEGPFRFSRNPMYLSVAIGYCGAAFWTGWWWALLILPLSLLSLKHFVIEREEAYMHRRFGDAYAAYCRRTRRWF